MADVKKVIKDLQGNFAKDNESQLKAVQLIKGLATSDDAIANKFMKALDTATTKISKDILGGSDKKEESVDTTDNKLVIKEGTKVIIGNQVHTLEAGDNILCE